VERHSETADPSTPPEAGSARDDKSKVLSDDRGPSTPAAQPQAACAQEDSVDYQELKADG
jgi:hypothetical protein